MKCSVSVILVLVACLYTLCQAQRFRPYEIIGVKRSATPEEIKKAYRRLVKELHPDKNKAPDAQENFVRLTKAYEILSDPERRRMYDNHGVTEDSPNFNKKHDYSQYNRHGDPFDHLRDLFGDSFHNFRSGNTRENIFHKQSITYKAYTNTVVPNSAKQPYLILFYSDWCFSCAQVMPMWAKLVEELEPVGFGMATVHSEHEREMARKVGVKELPHLVMLTDGKITHYRESILSVVKVLEFIRRKLPYKLVQRVNDHNVNEFLEGWMDNRVRILLFGKLDIVRLRYLAAGFRFRDRVAVGYVQVTQQDTKEIVERFKVNVRKDTLLVFQEDSNTPVASLAMDDIPTNTVIDVMEKHQYLQLPRLSNQKVFDSLCPPESTRVSKRLCVVLFTREAEGMEDHRQAMRDFVHSHKFSKDRVRFTYMLVERQAQFVNALIDNNEDISDPTLRVVLLWRRGEGQVKLEWLNNKWDTGVTNDSRDELETTLNRLLSSGEVLTREAVLESLLDEHAVSMFAKIANRMIEISEILRDNVTMDELIPAASLVATVGVIIAGGYLMSYLVKLEEEKVQKQLGEVDGHCPAIKNGHAPLKHGGSDPVVSDILPKHTM